MPDIDPSYSTSHSSSPPIPRQARTAHILLAIADGNRGQSAAALQLIDQFRPTCPAVVVARRAAEHEPCQKPPALA
jgi:hypothetical protein